MSYHKRTYFKDRASKEYDETEYIKIVLMAHYRFEKLFDYVVSECHFADVLASNGKHIYEFEIKISKSDLKQELKEDSKIKKHKFYRGELKQFGKRIKPNKFFYVIPDDMIDNKNKRAEIIEIVKSINPDYGIITICDGKYFRNVRLAKMLHSIKAKPYTLAKIIARLSSENIGLKEKIYEYKIEKHNKKDTD